ncbi:MAG: type II secretion system minor pseudopilin GspJ [Thiomicrorhabdus sp.]|jgi:general secretion pathway protein J|nr:type II secretion system minor pseudopilin GspJ [Thiomicrorhabdus sp.]
MNPFLQTEASIKTHQRGFTLIELLVALSISGVIAVLSYQSIDSVVRVQSSFFEHNDRMTAIQRTVWWLEQDVTQMVPRSIQDELGGRVPAFQYREDLGLELTRLAEFPTPFANAGLMRVGYYLEAEKLYRKVWPVVDRAADSEPVKLLLLDSVRRFSLRVLNQQTQWVDAWPDTEGSVTSLPKLVEVVIELKDKGTLTKLIKGVDSTSFALTVVATETTQSEEGEVVDIETGGTFQ